MTIALHALESPIGGLFAATSSRGLAMLEFADRFTEERNLRMLRRRFPHEEMTVAPAPVALAEWVSDYFGGVFRPFPMSLDAGGTPFQRTVWGRLAAIPCGETRAYQDIARDVERPLAVRAVARANGQNPLSIVVPCHRVIGRDGSLTGYGGGLWRKAWLLRHEGGTRAAHCEPRLSCNSTT